MDRTELAKILDEAAVNAKPISQLSLLNDITIRDAYIIQREAIRCREQRGHEIVGLKMGFTSIAKMEQMGVHDMIWGILTADMVIENGSEASLGNYIHPRAEPEVCFRISKDITAEVSLDELDQYVEAMAPAIEIIDSRYENFKFSLEDVVADNCSSTGFVIGPWQDPSRDIKNLSMELLFDGEVVASGSSADILGDPWKSLQAATRLASEYGEPIRKGHIILAGAATAAVFMKEGVEVSARVESMGETRFKVGS